MSAQNVPPHVIIGVASNNGVPVPAGTTISALVDNLKIGTSRTSGSGNFTLMAGNSDSHSDKTMTFSIGDSIANETLKWKKGEATRLNLTVRTSAQEPLDPVATTGEAGAIGSSGPKGATGESGPRGPQGPDGPIGPTGSIGKSGPLGPQGNPGPNAPIDTFTLIALLVSLITIVVSVATNIGGYIALSLFVVTNIASIFRRNKNRSKSYGVPINYTSPNIDPPSPSISISSDNICGQCQAKVDPSDLFLWKLWH